LFHGILRGLARADNGEGRAPRRMPVLVGENSGSAVGERPDIYGIHSTRRISGIKLKSHEKLAGEVKAPAWDRRARASVPAKGDCAGHAINWRMHSSPLALRPMPAVREGLFVTQVRGKAEQSAAPVGMSDRLGRPGVWSLPASSGTNFRLARHSGRISAIPAHSEMFKCRRAVLRSALL
jgi:hypothetical protein